MRIAPIKAKFPQEMMNLLFRSFTNEKDIQAVRKYFQQDLTLEELMVAMEFSFVNGFYQDLEGLINRNYKTEDTINIQCASVYEFYLNLMKGIKKEYPILDLSDPGLNCLNIFLTIHENYVENDFSMLGINVEKLSEQITQANFHPLLKKYFNLRLDKFKFIFHWKRNELLIARKYAYRMFYELYDPAKRCMVQMNLAETYLFESYNQAIYHANQSKKIAIEHNLEQASFLLDNKVFPLIHAFHNKTTEITSQIPTIAAYIEIKKQNLEKASLMLDNIPNKDGFYYYCLGLAKENKEYLKIAYEKYITEHHDYFYARLPVQTLHQLKI